MCSARLALLGALCAASLAGAQPLPRDTARAAAEARLARLEAAWEAAVRAAVEDSLQRLAARAPMDTLRVGAIVVLADSAAADAARDAAQDAWRALEATYGAAAGEASAMRFHVASVAPDTATRLRPWERARWEIGGADASGAREPRYASGDPRAAIRLFILTALEERLTGTLDRPFRDWLEGHVPAAAPGRDAYERPFVEMATHPTRPARACLAGDVASCALTLGLGDGDPIRTFYDAAGRRGLVRSIAPHVRHSLGSREDESRCFASRDESACLRRADETIARCTEGGDDATCDRILRLAEPARVPRFLEGGARRTLAQRALAAGGRDAFARLRASAGRPVGERLALAAGQPIDTLIAGWRATVAASRPRTVTLGAGTAWAAVAWVALLALASTRSSRWR